MPRDHARAKAVRDRMSETGERFKKAASALDAEPDAPRPSSEPRYLRTLLPPPRPAAACRSCGGHGVSGQMAEMPTGRDNELILLVDVLCAGCFGCGEAACECDPDSPMDFDWDDEELEEYYAASGGGPCQSCADHGWNRNQAIGTDEDGNDYVTYLKVPCGCMADWTVEAEDADLLDHSPQPDEYADEPDVHMPGRSFMSGPGPGDFSAICAVPVTDRASGGGPDGVIRVIAQPVRYRDAPALLVRAVDVLEAHDRMGGLWLNFWSLDLYDAGWRFDIGNPATGGWSAVIDAARHDSVVHLEVRNGEYVLFDGGVNLPDDWMKELSERAQMVVLAGPCALASIPEVLDDESIDALLATADLARALVPVTFTADER